MKAKDENAMKQDTEQEYQNDPVVDTNTDQDLECMEPGEPEPAPFDEPEHVEHEYPHGSHHHEHHDHHEHHEKSKPGKSVYYDAHGKAHLRRVRRKSNGKRGKVILITVLAVIGCAAAALLIAWRVMDSIGRRELYGNAVSEAPELAESGSSGDGSSTSEDSDWQAGWVRYKDHVYAYNDQILTFLVMGIDSDDPVETALDGMSGGQADAQFLLVLDPESKKISVVAINRNAMTDVDMYDEAGNYTGTATLQICLQHGYGDGREQSCERAVKAVSNLFYQLPIHGYIAINRGAIPMINGAIGGVELQILEDVPVFREPIAQLEYDHEDPIEILTKGETVRLNDNEAYWYTRWRSGQIYESADGRLAREEQYLRQFMPEMKLSLSKDPTRALDLYNALSDYMVTSINTNEVTYLAGQISSYSFDDDNIVSIPGKTTAGEDNESGFDEFYVDQDGLYDLMINTFYTQVK